MTDKWISVEDRLPEGDLPIHVLISAKRAGMERYVTSLSYLPAYGGFDHHYDRVTHWMPLPSPPEDL